MFARLLAVPALLLLVLPSCSLSGGAPDGPLPKSRIVEGGKDPKPYRIVKRQAPELPKYDQLVALSQDLTAADSELKTLWKTPIIDNSSHARRGIPKFRRSPELGERLRIASWNIEHSLNVPKIASALNDREAYDAMLKPGTPSMVAAEARRERDLLADADVLILQEMDIGHSRSGYRNAARELARALDMNYTYGLQHLEVDPAYLGISDAEVPNKDASRQTPSVSTDKRHLYHGMFGSAVLSRYPIKRVRLHPLKTLAYDWYGGERARNDILEQARRTGTKWVFHSETDREIKVGNRHFMQVDLHVPGLPHETLSVVNVHLEIKAKPEVRQAQMREILGYIKGIRNPVVLAGDFNSTLVDLSPTSVVRATARALTTPSDLFNLGLLFADVSRLTRLKNVINYHKNYRDPLAADIPVVMTNKQQPMFRMIRDYRFDDGGAFDFRGDPDSSRGHTGTLSNSNERFGKGFKFTFAVPRPVGPAGYEKLDWIFVKAFLQHPNDPNGKRRLAPHFGETLKAFNESVEGNFSDHRPILVDLPVHEPES